MPETSTERQGPNCSKGYRPGARPFKLLYPPEPREIHRLLDFGCGSLRLGRMAIPYLLEGHYFGIEPEP